MTLKICMLFFVKINSLLFILLCAWSLFPRSITNKTGKLTVQGMNDSECHGSGTMRTVQWARARITSNDSVQYIYILSTFPKTGNKERTFSCKDKSSINESIGPYMIHLSLPKDDSELDSTWRYCYYWQQLFGTYPARLKPGCIQPYS